MRVHGSRGRFRPARGIPGPPEGSLGGAGLGARWGAAASAGRSQRLPRWLLKHVRGHVQHLGGKQVTAMAGRPDPRLRRISARPRLPHRSRKDRVCALFPGGALGRGVVEDCEIDATPGRPTAALASPIDRACRGGLPGGAQWDDGLLQNRSRRPPARSEGRSRTEFTPGWSVGGAQWGIGPVSRCGRRRMAVRALTSAWRFAAPESSPAVIERDGGPAPGPFERHPRCPAPLPDQSVTPGPIRPALAMPGDGANKLGRHEPHPPAAVPLSRC